MSALDIFYRFGVPMISGAVAYLAASAAVRRWWPKKKRNK